MFSAAVSEILKPSHDAYMLFRFGTNPNASPRSMVLFHGMYTGRLSKEDFTPESVIVPEKGTDSLLYNSTRSSVPAKYTSLIVRFAA